MTELQYLVDLMTGDNDGCPHTQGSHALPCHRLKGQKLEEYQEFVRVTCTNVVSPKLLVLFSTSSKAEPLIMLRSSITDVLLLPARAPGNVGSLPLSAFKKGEVNRGSQDLQL